MRLIEILRDLRSNTMAFFACLILLLLGSGTLGYMLIEGWSILDGLYMTTITLFTIGYGETHPLSPGGRIFTIIYIFVGVGTLSYMITAVAQIILHSDIFSQQLNLRKIRAMSGHYIICGYGRIGHRIAGELRALKKDFVIIDQHADTIKMMNESSMPHIIGDATSEEVLLQAGIAKAKGLVSALSDDALNVFVTLTARGLNADLHIVARSDIASTVPKLIRAGANKVASPYDSGAARLTYMLLQKSVLDTFQLATAKYALDVIIEEFIIVNPRLVGRTLSDLALRTTYNAMVLAIVSEDNTFSFPPNPAYTLRENDRLVIALPQSMLETLGQYFL